jgi:16S rRNA (uracil1498-N3)-methyltransferase
MLPYFFSPVIEGAQCTMDEDTSKHMISVLRMHQGEELMLTDGKGQKAMARISNDNRKKCVVDILSITKEEKRSPAVHIAISLIKNATRFEWFLEKATEIGVSHILPVICERTEKEKFRADRLQQILVSAMIQSQQSWMPVLDAPISADQLIRKERPGPKFIAHCLPEHKQSLSGISSNGAGDPLILIGPEGDFSPGEIKLALEHGFIPVSLGETRLRTETAGVVAATLLVMGSLY